MSADTGPAAAYLAEVRKRHALVMMTDPDPVLFSGRFFATQQLACADSARLLAAVEAVLKAHCPEPSWGYLGEQQCESCGQQWPCATRQLVSRELLAEEK